MRCSIRIISAALLATFTVNAGENGVFDWDIERGHWAYQPLQDASVSVSRSLPPTWARHGVDHLVFKKALTANLRPAPEAAPTTLLRRVTLDLTGLPPDQSRVSAFNKAAETDHAYERAVDALLASPRFGERMASLWLPLARYAEDQAHQVGDDTKHFYPNAHLYRQWVVDAFNRDLPYDQFLLYQLAADLAGEKGRKNQLALGFIGLGPKYYNRGRLDVKAEEWEDRVDTVTRGLLGVSVACARCHDHKMEAFTMQDYYALAGIFASTQMANIPLPNAVPAKREDGKEAKKKNFPPEQCMHVVREGEAQDLPVYNRGDVTQPGPAVKHRFPVVLSRGEPVSFENGSGRLELAQAITGPARHLTARVFVNRVWEMLMGQAIVTTPSNFGKSGNPPVHPELLDHLAARFIDSSWSVKQLVREIALTSTYRQSAQTSATQMERDPGNRYFTRMNRRRLTAEMLRDSLLYVSGELDPQGGRSMELSDPNNHRRTLYGRVSRKQLDAYLAQFDYPDANVHCATRNNTSTPAQKLFFLNSDFILKRSEFLTNLIVSSQTEATTGDRIRSTYQRILTRAPDPHEHRIADRFLGQHGTPDKERWIQFTQALFASNAFQYRD